MLRLTYDPQGPKTPTVEELEARVNGILDFVGGLLPKLQKIAEDAAAAIALRRAAAEKGTGDRPEVKEVCPTARIVAALRDEMGSC